jgi:hypothetical protein
MHRHEQEEKDGRQNAEGPADPQEPARRSIRAFLRLVAAEVVGRLKREQDPQPETGMAKPRSKGSSRRGRS